MRTTDRLPAVGAGAGQHGKPLPQQAGPFLALGDLGFGRGGRGGDLLRFDRGDQTGLGKP